MFAFYLFFFFCLKHIFSQHGEISVHCALTSGWRGFMMCVYVCVSEVLNCICFSFKRFITKKKKKPYQKHITVLFLSIPNRFEIILWGLTFWKYILSDLYFCRSVPIYHKMFWSKCVKLRFLGRKPEKSKQIYSLLMLSLKICIAAVLLKILFAL